jgi:nickel transport protein
VAVRALFADGRGLARARYQVFSPAEPGIPWQEGETDRDGWLAFVPDAPGRWRVKVVDASGHGLDVGVDVEASAARAAPSPGAAAAFLRPALGAVVAAAVFAALIAWRRRGAART